MNDLNRLLLDQFKVFVAEALNGPNPRIVRERFKCEHVDDETGPCTFEGLADLAVFDQTREALWWCPLGHENSERYGDFA